MTIFLQVNGEGPWPCCWCGHPVTRDELIVHHLDENHDNNDPTNLAPVHRPCHGAIHLTGKPGYWLGRKQPSEMTAKRSASLLKANAEGRGAKDYPGRNAKISAKRRGQTGQVHSPETRRKIGIGSRQTRLRERFQCTECGIVTNAGALAGHHRASGHVGRVRVTP